MSGTETHRNGCFKKRALQELQIQGPWQQKHKWTNLKSIKVKISIAWLEFALLSTWWWELNIFLPCYLRSDALRVVQYSLKWGTAAILHSAGTGPPSTLFWKISFARMKPVLARALKSLTKVLISHFKYMNMSILKWPINFKRVHFVLG